MTNQEIAQVFDKLAFFLSLKNENEFKINAYRQAARAIEDHPVLLEEMLLAGEDITTIRGIGRIIAKKVEDLIIFGTIPTLEKLLSELPEGLFEITRIKGIGPKTILKLHQIHRVRCLSDLKKLVQRGVRLEIADAAERHIIEFFGQ